MVIKGTKRRCLAPSKRCYRRCLFGRPDFERDYGVAIYIRFAQIASVRKFSSRNKQHRTRLPTGTFRPALSYFPGVLSKGMPRTRAAPGGVMSLQKRYRVIPSKELPESQHEVRTKPRNWFCAFGAQASRKTGRVDQAELLALVVSRLVVVVIPVLSSPARVLLAQHSVSRTMPACAFSDRRLIDAFSY